MPDHHHVQTDIKVNRDASLVEREGMSISPRQGKQRVIRTKLVKKNGASTVSNLALVVIELRGRVVYSLI